jgi:hypothetical protein
MKHIVITISAVITAIALSGLAASSAWATPPLSCYKAQEDEFGVTGNYKNATCTEKVAVLKGEYVLAEPLLFMKEDLWCAKMSPVVGPPGTGLYENATCTKTQEDGEYTEVIEPAQPPSGCYEALKESGGGLTGDYKNAACTEKTAVLKSLYVLAEPLLLLKGETWCAKMSPVVGPPGTGRYENATCTKAKENGEYTEVKVEPTVPRILPLGTVGELVTFSSSSLNAAFGSAGLAEVTSASSLGESNSTGTEGNTGEFHETYSGVKSGLLGICTGTGNGVGIVLVLGSFQLKDADLASKSIVVVLFLLKQVQFLCGTIEITVAGCVAGNLTPVSTLATVLTVELSRIGNDDEITSYLSSTGLPEFCLLSAKVGAGTTELSAQNQTVELFNFKQGGKAIEVLLML